MDGRISHASLPCRCFHSRPHLCVRVSFGAKVIVSGSVIVAHDRRRLSSSVIESEIEIERESCVVCDQVIESVIVSVSVTGKIGANENENESESDALILILIDSACYHQTVWQQLHWMRMRLRQQTQAQMQQWLMFPSWRVSVSVSVTLNDATDGEMVIEMEKMNVTMSVSVMKILRIVRTYVSGVRRMMSDASVDFCFCLCFYFCFDCVVIHLRRSNQLRSQNKNHCCCWDSCSVVSFASYLSSYFGYGCCHVSIASSSCPPSSSSCSSSPSLSFLYYLHLFSLLLLLLIFLLFHD